MSTQNGQTPISHLFLGTGGDGVDPAGLPGADEPSASDLEFTNNFRTPTTGINGGGPIMNANANLLPTRSDTFRDISSTHDYRMNNGLGVSKAYRKPDSQGGQTVDGFHGRANPTKLFGRTSRGFDLNLNRDDHMNRARMALPTMGSKANEVPQGANYFPWQWNDHVAMGEAPKNNPNQYNRNYGLPDADQAARRLYQPAPSRLSKMLNTDTEDASLRPQQTAMHPMKVVTEDRTRMALQRISKNADVMEAVTFENIAPRGMSNKTGTYKVWADASALRQPVGSNDTGDKSVHGRWQAPSSVGTEPLHAMHMEDRLQAAKHMYHYVDGKEPHLEERHFMERELALSRQTARDSTKINKHATNIPREVRYG